MAVSVGDGDLLIAPPNMLDPRFGNTVLLITKHDIDGSWALCLNKPTDYTIGEIIKPLKLELDRDPVVYWGGPVAQNTVWMLHDNTWEIENTARINDQWSVTSHHQMFHYMSNGNWPEQYRIMLGHAGWSPGQLERELNGEEPWDQNHSWLVAHQPNPEWLLGCDPEGMWSSACSFCSQQTIDSWLTS